MPSRNSRSIPIIERTLMKSRLIQFCIILSMLLVFGAQTQILFKASYRLHDLVRIEGQLQELKVQVALGGGSLTDEDKFKITMKANEKKIELGGIQRMMLFVTFLNITLLVVGISGTLCCRHGCCKGAEK